MPDRTGQNWAGLDHQCRGSRAGLGSTKASSEKPFPRIESREGRGSRKL